MPVEPIQALQAAARAAPPPAPGARLVIAGAAGVLGTEVLRRLAGLHRFTATQVLAREPITAGMRGVAALLVPEAPPTDWPPAPADTGLIMFEPPRLFHDRERALWVPQPEDLPLVAQWMRGSGVRTLVVVLPYQQGRLPEALKHGLAGLDEHAVASLGFERVIIVRTARKPAPPPKAGLLHALAGTMLSVMKYMVPSSEQPVRAVKVAEFVAAALDLAPPGTHVAAPETVWRAAQGDVRSAVHAWLGA